jgi:hypothetical protein
LLTSTTERNCYNYIKEGKKLLKDTIHEPKGLLKYL